jgi:hypothetical protein
MPLLYGERHRAFKRLQEEIIRTSIDLSVLAWELAEEVLNDPAVGEAHDILAGSAAQFAKCSHFRTIKSEGLAFSLSNGVLRGNLPIKLRRN